MKLNMYIVDIIIIIAIDYVIRPILTSLVKVGSMLGTISSLLFMT